MMTDTRIYAYYLGDGLIVCPGCYDPDTDGLPGAEGIYPIYSHEDDGEGMSCERCSEYIFEPYEEEVEDED